MLGCKHFFKLYIEGINGCLYERQKTGSRFWEGRDEKL